MTEEHSPTERAPAPPDLVTEKMHGVLGAMGEAIIAVLASDSSDRFARAGRLCVMGQKLSIEVVASVRDAMKAQAEQQQAFALGGGYGHEAQYIAQGGGDIGGYLGDGALLNGVALYPPARANDQVTLQRDLMMMLQGFLEDQKKSRAVTLLPLATSRLDTCAELARLLELRDKARAPEDMTHLGAINKIIDELLGQLAQERKDNDAPADPHLSTPGKEMFVRGIPD